MCGFLSRLRKRLSRSHRYQTMDQATKLSPANSSSLPSTPDQSATTSCSRIYNPCSGVSLAVSRKSKKVKTCLDTFEARREPFSKEGDVSPKKRSRYCLSLWRSRHIPASRSRSRNPIAIHCISYPDDIDGDYDGRESRKVWESPKGFTPTEPEMTGQGFKSPKLDVSVKREATLKREKRSAKSNNGQNPEQTSPVTNCSVYGVGELIPTRSGAEGESNICENDPEIERIRTFYKSGVRSFIQSNSSGNIVGDGAHQSRTFSRTEILKLSDALSASKGSETRGHCALNPRAENIRQQANGIRASGFHGSDGAANRMRGSDNSDSKMEAVPEVRDVRCDDWNSSSEIRKDDPNVQYPETKVCGKSALRHSCSGLPETNGIPQILRMKEEKTADKLKISLSLNAEFDAMNLAEQQRFRLYE